MENAEEVMQLLEEFSKIKPKEIPQELENYLGYVAKTGDPVYQWSLIKHLFREKLLSVITDFYESTLTVELPPCPNVEPFNYERMKTSLLERFDTFSSAPYTVQRICELLIMPRKEYNRADKYMRAIEKNILVVSTREPGMGKRPLESDSQPETVLNGIPDMKSSESDGSLLHVPTDLPYLGAPPASNDITVETTETNVTASERVVLDTDGESKVLNSTADKLWTVQESASIAQEQSNSRTDTTDASVSAEEKCPEEKDCDTIDRPDLATIDSSSSNVSSESVDGECSLDTVTENESILPDSIHSSQEEPEVQPSLTQENDDIENNSDENEVSSTPVEASIEVPIIQEVEEPTDSEAEATNTSIVQESESDINSSSDVEINSSDRVIETDESKLITISEVTATKSDEVDLECNEITGTVVSPISPGSSSNLQADEVDQNININILEESEEPDSHPDSSNDVSEENKTHVIIESQQPEISSEADSISETNDEAVSESEGQNYFPESAPDQSNKEILCDNIAQVSSPGSDKIIEEECVVEASENPVLSSSSQEDNMVSGGPCLEDNLAKSTEEIQSTSDQVNEMYDQESREESVIHSVSNITPDSQQITTIEEINVDPSCEAEEEAMDVDDTSNQMMISECENEGEPMDQSDQIQS
uniref:Serine/threonine-protein phosphatase 4 regulatory subunit 2 n=1 Tax=Graphocephala atropunctata TaxID=36148 RepID=A0A1B6MDA2_9HEMI